MQRIYIHPLPVRVWHWINAIGFLTMILTGTQLRYIDVFTVLSFRTAVTVHNWTGLLLIANYFIWLLFYLFSDKIRVYHPELSPAKHFRASFRQLQYYGYGIFKGSPNPHQVSAYDKFNPMQSMMYQVVMLMLVPLVFVTGILLWDVKGFPGAVAFFGGVRVVDTVHVLIYIVLVFFVFFHVYMGSLGHTPTAHYKAMFITGYEEVDGEGEPHQAATEEASS
jgi:thiosulfate reductase cytochrome b subunit